MRKSSLLPLPTMLQASLLAMCVWPAGVSPAERHEHRDLPVRAQETIQKSFSLPAGAHKALDIDNVFGSVEVTAGGSNEVQVTVAKTIYSESNDSLERAKREVTLDIEQHDGALKLYVNGPFRCHCDDCQGARDDRGYIVKMDFRVVVPAEIDLRISNVNDGDVKVTGVSGEFRVHNVNGRIEMAGVAGSGTVSTVNGPVKVSFRKNPGTSSDFKTINGDVELRFASGLSADFRFKTFNGGIYTDFPVTALPARNVSEEHKGGKLILRADRSTGARIGSGGPEIKVENLNGDIRILENNE